MTGELKYVAIQSRSINRFREIASYNRKPELSCWYTYLSSLTSTVIGANVGRNQVVCDKIQRYKRIMQSVL